MAFRPFIIFSFLSFFGIPLLACTALLEASMANKAGILHKAANVRIFPIICTVSSFVD